MNYYPYSSPYGTPQNRAQYGVPSYGGYNYTPQPQQMQSMPQNQPQAQPQYEMPIQYVGNGTLKEAEAYILFPRQKAFFIDIANGMVYEKVCDQDGQSFISRFKRIDDTDENKPAKKENPTQPDFKDFVKLSDMNTFGYATMADIKAMGFATTEQLSQLSQKIDALQKQNTGVKPNVGTSKPQV